MVYIVKLTKVRYTPVHNTSLDLQISQRIVCSHFAANHTTCALFGELLENDVPRRHVRFEADSILLYYSSAKVAVAVGEPSFSEPSHDEKER